MSKWGFEFAYGGCLPEDFDVFDSKEDAMEYLKERVDELNELALSDDEPVWELRSNGMYAEELGAWKTAYMQVLEMDAWEIEAWEAENPDEYDEPEADHCDECGCEVEYCECNLEEEINNDD